MLLPQNDEMVQALASDRSNQPFGKAILPRRGRCDRLVPNTHGAQSAGDDGAIDSIPIADEVALQQLADEVIEWRSMSAIGTWRTSQPNHLSPLSGV